MLDSNEKMLPWVKGRYFKTDKGRIGIFTTDRYEYRDDYDQDIRFINGDTDSLWEMYDEDIIDCQNTMIELINVGDYVNGKQVVTKLIAYDNSQKELTLINGEIIKSDSQITSIVTLEVFNREGKFDVDYLKEIIEINQQKEGRSR